MLIEFAVENFKSIRTEARLNLTAGRGNEKRDTHLVEPELSGDVHNEPLVRSVAIYGPNAAGKSNLVDALATMKNIVTHSTEHLAELPVIPFRLDPDYEDEATMLEVLCIAEGVRYQYGFRATRHHVTDEWLFAWPRGRLQIWFERTEKEWQFGPKLKGDKKVWQRATRSNALYLSTAVSLNSEQLRPIYDWFEKKLKVIDAQGWSDLYSMSWCRDQRKREIVDFLNVADLGISDIRVVEEEYQPPQLEGDMDPDWKQYLEKLEEKLVGKKFPNLRLSHNIGKSSSSELLLEDESDGTQRIFALAGPWLDSLKNGNVIVFDELHTSLHPALVRFLADQFHDPRLNVGGAQLVFTTHDTSILNQDVFRRDQIWFCERNEKQETHLFPLTEFSPRKGLENLERSYLTGRYGALPFFEQRI
ncbi:MAG: AAA family ATPase [Gammaproteobacteria bacterium]|nr:AAA family ATPase [Gammaproteobacteria bacterium]